ncbi:MAG: NAD-dependent epimerase/dehydratase family protein [Nitrospirota bacterium]
MKIFITGATGYIGFSVATALRRAGHDVWGLARTEGKAQLLTRNEIHPVPGSLQAPDSFRTIAEECSVLIHAAADYTTDTFSLDRKVVAELLTATKKGPRPKMLIYTSGVWLHGDTGGRLVDETAPLNPPKLVSLRPATEELVLKASGMRGLVIRPGCVYGRQGGLTGTWFKGAHVDKALKVVGDGNNRWAMVHVDDLADGYVRAAESGLTGEAFNLVDRSRATVGDMARYVACAAGYEGKIEFLPVDVAAKNVGDMAECLAMDQQIDGRKAMRLLGWQPQHNGFIDEVETYFASWKAAQ